MARRTDLESLLAELLVYARRDGDEMAADADDGDVSRAVTPVTLTETYMRL